MPSAEYFAGFFDGEGSVSISNLGRVCVSVGQNRRQVLDEHVRMFGGKVYGPYRPRIIHYWRSVHTDTSKEFLTTILPYSIVKPEEIKLGLKALGLTRTNNRGCNPLTGSELGERLSVRRELQRIRPVSTFRDVPPIRVSKRQDIKDEAGYKCTDCKKDLKGYGISHQVISDGDLVCRACNLNRHRFDKRRPLSKVEILSAIVLAGGIVAAAKHLHVSRAHFYKQRVRNGLIANKETQNVPNKI